MKKTLTIIFGVLLFSSCTKDDFIPQPQVEVKPELQINSTVGIKLETTFVTNEVSMNVKTETSGTVVIKIFDISNKVVSKEVTTVNAGDNILKVYTSALPNSAYRIGLFDSNGVRLGITDFNKIQ
jgi:PBP1b-binding outer membrane lipoprotein LpoB